MGQTGYLYGKPHNIPKNQFQVECTSKCKRQINKASKRYTKYLHHLRVGKDS